MIYMGRQMTRHTESSDEKLLWTPENTQERNFWAEAVSNMGMCARKGHEYMCVYDVQDALDDEPETEAEDECVKSSASVIVSIVPPVAGTSANCKSNSVYVEISTLDFLEQLLRANRSLFE